MKAVLMFFLLLLLLLMLPAPTRGQPPQELSLRNGDQPVAGTLVPVDDPAAPLAILIAGSGPTDRDGNQPGMQNDSLRLLADGLAAQGIASFRYDKRGIGASAATQGEAELRLDHFAGDVVAVSQAMRDRFPESPIYLIGHSEGALLALVAADRSPVEGLVLLAGAGRPATEVLHEQLAKRAPAALLAKADAIMERLLAGETVDDVPPELAALFRPSVQPYLRSWFALDPVELAADTDHPMLVIQGSTDLQVTMADACRLADASGEIRVLAIEGMNHVLKEASGGLETQMASYRDPTMPLHADLVPAIAAFVRGDTPGMPRCQVVEAVAEAPACSGAERFRGDWSGSLAGPGIRVVFHLEEGETACLSGSFDSPDQGGFGLPLSEVSATDGQLLIRGDAFGFHFEGQWQADGSIAGTFHQAGSQFPLTLSPAGPAE